MNTFSWWVLMPALAVACDMPVPTSEESETPQPPGSPLAVGERVSELGHTRLARKFKTVVPRRVLDRSPLGFRNADQERYGLSRFDLEYVEAEAITPGEDRTLYVCRPRPEPSPNGALSIEEDEHWKTPDGAPTFFQPDGTACDPSIRYRAQWVYLGHVRISPKTRAVEAAVRHAIETRKLQGTREREGNHHVVAVVTSDIDLTESLVGPVAYVPEERDEPPANRIELCSVVEVQPDGSYIVTIEEVSRSGLILPPGHWLAESQSYISYRMFVRWDGEDWDVEYNEHWGTEI